MADAAHQHPWKISDVVLFPLAVLGGIAEWLWPTRIAGFPNVWLIVAGVLLALAGAGLIGWAKRTLDAGAQPNLPGVPTTELLTGGAFRVSRNPNYLGTVLIALGLGLALDSLWLLGTALVSALVLDRWMIAPEERYLSARFGETYAGYRRQVRRWL
ncbi:methyltransferase family protein [Halovulum sp. GXIMD14794]